MKSRSIASAFLACSLLSGYSGISLAESCYSVEGDTNTRNITPTLQIGDISLRLSDESGIEVLNESGPLIGNITGSEGIGTVLLSHRASFPFGDIFVTKNDKAVLAAPYVRAALPDGVTACSFFMKETISEIANGKGLFSNVISVNILAEGYISNCPDENRNEFTLSGNICVE
jgi:hypothetical protein